MGMNNMMGGNMQGMGMGMNNMAAMQGINNAMMGGMNPQMMNN